jgi:hypothetical protein
MRLGTFWHRDPVPCMFLFKGEWGISPLMHEGFCCMRRMWACRAMCANGELALYMSTTIVDRTVRAGSALAECVHACRLPLEMDGSSSSPGSGGQCDWHGRDTPMSLACMCCAGMLVALWWVCVCHRLLAATSPDAWLRCGGVRVARRWAHMEASPCPGRIAQLGAPQLRGPLAAGNFDAALWLAPPEVVGLATSLGWKRREDAGGMRERAYDDRDLVPD